MTEVAWAIVAVVAAPESVIDPASARAVVVQVVIAWAIAVYPAVHEVRVVVLDVTMAAAAERVPAPAAAEVRPAWEVSAVVVAAAVVAAVPVVAAAVVAAEVVAAVVAVAVVEGGNE